MGEILTPFGDYGTPGPVEGVIEILRGLLKRAESGEIVGLSYGFVRPNGSISFGYKVGTASCNVLLGAVCMPEQQLATDILNIALEVEMPSAS